MVWCAMLRHAETPKGPRGVPKLSNDRFKDGPLHGPVGRLFSLRIVIPSQARDLLSNHHSCGENNPLIGTLLKSFRTHVSPSHPPWQCFSSYLSFPVRL